MRECDLQRNSGESCACSKVQQGKVISGQINRPADQKAVQEMPGQNLFPVCDGREIHHFILLRQHLVIADKLPDLLLRQVNIQLFTSIDKCRNVVIIYIYIHRYILRYSVPGALAESDSASPSLSIFITTTGLYYS